jgi:hypothetical protein
MSAPRAVRPSAQVDQGGQEMRLNGKEYAVRFSPDGLTERVIDVLLREVGGGGAVARGRWAGGSVSGPVTHPAWCDSRRCFETDADIQHCSELLPLRTREARLTLAWVRADGFDADCPGETELRIDIVRETPGGGEGTQLFLLPQEVYRLAEQLLSGYWRECYQRTPVVRRDPAVAS